LFEKLVVWMIKRPSTPFEQELGLEMFVESYHSEFRLEEEDSWISYVYDLSGLKMAFRCYRDSLKEFIRLMEDNKRYKAELTDAIHTVENLKDLVKA
jgi:hypothetical protein